MSQGNGHVERRRDIAHERAFTAAAAHLVERSPAPIRQLAEERARVLREELAEIENTAERLRAARAAMEAPTIKAVA